ncbi:uncharacterized protein LOC132862424 [Tachysurus vachellii]|uniref:uncharacterized protein LOC132862424 n=1 Tax=Tachysurus vachellii TaxID=175792 RepID=UPI00296B2EF9|nr:uncharacterized protein LOC132862424 [Tachysurus vachellii]
MDPSPPGRSAHPSRPIRSSPHHSRPSPYTRPVPAEVMETYRRLQLLHITRELVTCLEQLCSPDLPLYPHLLFHIVRGPLPSTSTTQTTPLPNLVDQRTQTDGCPHVEPCNPELGTPDSPPRPPVPYAYVRPLSPALASPPSDSSSDYNPGSPDYTPTSPSDYYDYE